MIIDGIEYKKEEVVLVDDIKLDTDDLKKYMKDQANKVFDGINTYTYLQCTHDRCRQCGEYKEKQKVLCNKCYEGNAQKLYVKKDFVFWPLDAVVYSALLDSYFKSPLELKAFINNNPDQYSGSAMEIGIKLRLYLCRQDRFPEIDEDYFTDYFCDKDTDIYLTQAAKDLIDQLNNELISYETGVFVPTDVAVRLEN